MNRQVPPSYFKNSYLPSKEVQIPKELHDWCDVLSEIDSLNLSHTHAVGNNDVERLMWLVKYTDRKIKQYEQILSTREIKQYKTTRITESNSAIKTALTVKTKQNEQYKRLLDTLDKYKDKFKIQVTRVPILRLVKTTNPHQTPPSTSTDPS